MPEPQSIDSIGSFATRILTGVVLLLSATLLHSQSVIGAEPVRVAVLKFGTASWELETIRHHGLDLEHGIDLELMELAGKQATMVALQGRQVDIALTDWLWVSRQRAAGQDYSFLPYSTAAGALVVGKDSDIGSLKDLIGKRVGIAGGPLDKNWLLFRALALRAGDRDLAEVSVPVFGAPPLLNEQLRQGRVDAVINFWPHVARLTAEGMQVLISTRDAVHQLGISSDLALIGHVFHDDWAWANPESISGFMSALTEARSLLAKDDAEWERLRPLMRAPDQPTFEALRDSWRSGIPKPMNPATVSDASRLFVLLARLGGEKLVGNSTTLSPGTFWHINDN